MNMNLNPKWKHAIKITLLTLVNLYLVIMTGALLLKVLNLSALADYPCLNVQKGCGPLGTLTDEFLAYAPLFMITLALTYFFALKDKKWALYVNLTPVVLGGITLFYVSNLIR